MNKGKKILILTREYSSKTRRNDRWTMIVSQFAKEWARENEVIVIINSVRFPAFYYLFISFTKALVAKVYGKDASLLKDRSWGRPFSFMDGSIRVYNLPRTKLFPHARLFKWQLKRQEMQIRRILDNNRFVPDVIDAHWINPQLDLLLLLKKNYSAKTALVVHREAVLEEYHTKRVEDALNQLDHVGCRSRVGAETLYKNCHLKKMPFVCSSGIPDEYFKKVVEEKIINTNNPVICTVSRLLNWKCLDAAIRGVAHAYNGEQYQYNIYGDGSERNSLEHLINSEGLGTKVFLRGRVTRDDVIARMQEADIFVMISKHETFGLVYLEAMAQGCITIASINGGIDGIIVDGENGFLCHEGDEKALTELLLKIRGMRKEQLHEISVKAQKTAREYTDSKVAKKYLAEICK